MDKLGKRLLGGAKTEIKVPETVSLEVSVYSVGTGRPMQAVLDLLKDREFTPASRLGDFQPRVIDVSGDRSKVLEVFAELSKPRLVSEATLSVSAGVQAIVSATRSMSYAMQTTTETDLNGSKRVREKKGEIRFGVSLYLEPVVTPQGALELTCHREVSRPTDAAQVGTGKGLMRLVHTSSSARGRLKPEDAFVHAEFLRAENPTPRFSGEIIVTVISANVVG